MKLMNLRILQVVALGVFLSVFYTNCSGTQKGQENAIVGLDSGSFGLACEDQIKSKYSKIIQPFLSQEKTCGSCHIEGGIGLGSFASKDTETSYNSFKSAGFSKITLQAVNAGHKPPHTGPQNKTAINNISVIWPKVESDYLACLSKVDGGGADESILTSSKPAVNIYNNKATQTLSWDLEIADDLDKLEERTVSAVVSVDIKILYQTVDGVENVIGYIFSDPKIQLKTASDQIIVEGVYVYINDQLIQSQTAFTFVSKVIAGTALNTLMQGKGSTIIDPVKTTDTFALYIRRIVPTSENGGISAPPTPNLTLRNPSTGSDKFISTTTVSTSINKDNGIVRWCLSESDTGPATTEDPCPGQEAVIGTVNGWFVNRPTAFDVSAGDGLKKVNLWVANGNLKINNTAAFDSITLDTVAPDAPTISVTDNNLTAGEIPITGLNITNDTTVKGWCVIEQNYIMAAPGKPMLNDVCWRWSYDGSKPDTVGFKGGGQRDVFVFVRDEAGNVSDSSNSTRVTNALGSITYTQLTGPATDPRSVLTNNCLACHTPGGPGYQRLRLFEYKEAARVGDTGLLVSRTNNPVSPMPNISGGLMSKNQRDMIRLWTMPENSDEFEP